MDKNYLLEVTEISKHFGGINALSNVNFEVKRGEVVGLVGENGAGKSTLIKIISGVHSKDSGQMIFDGKEINPQNPQEVKKLGIITIHQELSVIPCLSVANNIFLNREPHILGFLDFIDKKKMNKETIEILSDLGINIPINSLLRDLPIASQQMVEIGRAVNCNAQVLLMDEPTSSLSKTEVETLFTIINRLKNKGVSIVFISHRLEEVLEISDRIIVMRDGIRVGELKTKDATQSKICQMMVGRDFIRFPKEENPIGSVIFEAKNLSGVNFIKDISFKIKKGEILGLAGLVGAGRTELARIIFGADKRESGQIFIDDTQVRIKSPNDAVRFGISYIPEDRKVHGLLMNMDVKDNATITILNRLVNIFDKLNRKEQINLTKEYIKKISIVASSPFVKVNTLSGGNQQKVVISKWLMTKPKLLIMDEPTRGIDVGAKSEIHSIISHLAKEGMAILLISSELPEIIGMSDRILVMCQGRITGEFEKKDLSEESIMECATKFITSEPLLKVYES